MATSGERSPHRNTATSEIEPAQPDLAGWRPRPPRASTTNSYFHDRPGSTDMDPNLRTGTMNQEPESLNYLDSPKLQPESARWRQYSLNPFEPDGPAPGSEPVNAMGTANGTAGTPGVDGSGRLLGQRMASTFSGYTTYTSKSQATSQAPERKEDDHPPLKNPGSEWVYLFYDLAWSASFASLTDKGDFEKPLDTMNYFLFFAAVLWLWSSQTLYSIHFYTNDWFHLLSTFSQLFLFGMLSATILGYDVTTYITHSPGLGNDKDDKPDQYAEGRKAFLSMLVLGIAFTATRLIHLIQYLRVLYYAYWSKKKEPSKSAKSGAVRSGIAALLPPRPWISSIPPQLIAITAGLLISNPMFIAALGITASDLGSTVLGASLKLGLWILGFIVEVVSHLIMPVWWWITKPRAEHPKPSDQEASGGTTPQPTYRQAVAIPPERKLPVPTGMHLYKRTQTITTIILGEGINGIAGTLSTVMLTPGVGRTVGVNVVSTACIIWFIAYIYFEGPRGETSPKITSLRYMIWLLLHLPFLASTVLLLIGIKTQFLLTSFLSALFGSIQEFNEIMKSELLGHSNATYWRTNPKMRNFLLKRGIVWADEFDEFWNTTAGGTQTGQGMTMPVWSLRLSMKMVINTFKSINDDDGISDETQTKIDEYYEDFAQIALDVVNINNPEESKYYQILTEVLHGFILSTRYVIAFAGVILISLSLQDFIHSPNNNWYQRRVIATRFLMGVVLCLLLLLNLGKYQVLFVPFEVQDQRAGVFLWLEAFWVLPTMAIGYGLQFLVEVFLGWRDKVTAERKKQAEGQAKTKEEEETEKE